MEAYKEDKTHFLRLDRGEDLVSNVLSYCDRAGIRCASVKGIGAVEDVELGYYDLSAKEYLRRKYDGIYELLSLAGNVAKVDGKAFMHAHALIASRELEVHGGHFFGGKIGVVGEIFLVECGLPLTRKMNDAIGLKLIAKDE